jgi:tetratricopeptide (TPR) repeat protein
MTPRLIAARRTWNRGRPSQALALFQEAVRHEPNNVRAYYEAARASADFGDFRRFEELVGQLRQVAPQHPGTHHLAGELYQWLSMPQRAAACFERASQLPGVRPGSLLGLAALYERMHRLDEARALLDRALAAKPGLPQGQLLDARLARRGGEEGRAEAILRRLIESLPEEAPARLEALGDLAALLDLQGDFSGAWEAVSECKRLQRGREAAEWAASEHVLRRFQAAIDTIDPADFRRWHEDRRGFVPERIALLTGFPRSGTTLLEQVFKAHPSILGAEERDFLSRHSFPALHNGLSHAAPVQEVLDRADRKRLQVERRRYWEAMEFFLGEPTRGRLLLDKNPAYNPVLPIMLRMFPELRIVVALRDPRDVVLSCYLRYLPLNPVSVRFLTLERTVERYALDMAAWLRYRDMVLAPWCEVRYEDAVGDLEGEARRAMGTLDVPWDDSVMQYRDRLVEAPVMSPTYESVARPVYKTAVGRWRNYASRLAPHFDRLAPYVKAFGYE